ncbi:MAG: DUF368 domain-containing protein [Defluviitaleaceae bacterium]|nr:DUF368 domain-containing protein [Defluviitaleaceae bacterium]
MIKNFLFRIFCGFFLGLSIFAPGFSGSVVAIIMGIYKDLLDIASNPLKNLKKNILFLLPLIIGAGVSAVPFVFGFKYLFDTYEKATYLMFVGLIAGNLPVIFGSVKKSGYKQKYLFGGIGAFVFALFVSVAAISGMQAAAQTDGFGIGLPMLSLGGLAAGIAAPVPGMSLSTVLILMGVYYPLIFAAESIMRMSFDYLPHFFLFLLCVAAGIVLASRGIKTIFEKYPGFANTTVLGFMAGSLAGILIQAHNLNDPNFTWFSGIAMLVAGLAVSAVFVFVGAKLNAGNDRDD